MVWARHKEEAMMANVKVMFRQVSGFGIIKAFQNFPKKQVDVEEIKDSIKKDIFKGNYVNLFNDNSLNIAMLVKPGLGLGIMSYKENEVEIPILSNSLLSIVKIGVGSGFQTSTSFYEMYFVNADDTQEEANGNEIIAAEKPVEALLDSSVPRVTEEILYKGIKLSDSGNQYGRYMTPEGQSYILIEKIHRHSKFNRVRAVRIGDPIKLDVHKRYVFPAFMIIWNGPCKDRYGNFLMPDNIVESTLVHATQTKGMFRKNGANEKSERSEDKELGTVDAKEVIGTV